MQLKTKLTMLRNMRGYSLIDIQQLANIDEKMLEKYELGIKKPNIEQLIALANIFDISVNILINENIYLKIDNENMKIKTINQKEDKLGINIALYSTLIFTFPILILIPIFILIFIVMGGFLVGFIYILDFASFILSILSISLLFINLYNIPALLICIGGFLFFSSLSYILWNIAGWWTKKYPLIIKDIFREIIHFNIKDLIK